jgi:hypothetical protein
MTDTITRKSEPNELGTPPEGEQFEVTWRSRFAEFADESDDDAGIAGWSCSGLEARGGSQTCGYRRRNVPAG